MVASLNGERIYVTASVYLGKSFIEIIRQVLLNNHDLVIKEAEPEICVFGNKDLHLMRKCPCPVWVVKSVNKARCKRILAAVDLALQTEEGQKMNKLIMDLATSLACWESSQLY